MLENILIKSLRRQTNAFASLLERLYNGIHVVYKCHYSHTDRNRAISRVHLGCAARTHSVTQVIFFFGLCITAFFALHYQLELELDGYAKQIWTRGGFSRTQRNKMVEWSVLLEFPDGMCTTNIWHEQQNATDPWTVSLAKIRCHFWVNYIDEKTLNHSNSCQF